MDAAREHLGGQEDQPQELSNSAARADTIRSACREISKLEAERKSIGKQISSIKQKKVKGDLGMKIADFNVALRLYGLEAEDRDGFFELIAGDVRGAWCRRATRLDRRAGSR